MMNAGILNEIISIYKPTVTRNIYNEQETTYTKSHSTRAEVRYKSGSRTDENNETFYAYTRTFCVRAYNNINEFDHIEWDGKMYRILNIDFNRIKNCKYIDAELINE